MSELNNEKFVEIFNASIDDLVELTYDESLPKREALYVEMLVNYMQDNTDKLELIVKKIESHKEFEDHEIIVQASKLRLMCCKSELDEKLIEDSLKLVNDYPFWKGEIYTIVAYIYATNKIHVKAKVFFKKSYTDYYKVGAKKAGLFSLQNVIVCETYVHPDKNVIGDYQHLIRKAKKEKFTSISGMAQFNLSQQYHRKGSHITALSEIDKALEDLEDSSMGSIQYYLALAHKAHVLIELSRVKEAERIIDEIACHKHKKVEDVCNFLKEMISNRKLAEAHDMSKLVPSWNNRLKLNKKLGELEEKLLSFVAEEPREKYEIISHIYGDNLDMYTLENRFKRLLLRFRKKAPGLIIYSDGKYCITSEAALEEIKGVS